MERLSDDTATRIERPRGVRQPDQRREHDERHDPRFHQRDKISGAGEASSQAGWGSDLVQPGLSMCQRHGSLSYGQMFITLPRHAAHRHDGAEGFTAHGPDHQDRHHYARDEMRYRLY